MGHLRYAPGKTFDLDRSRFYLVGCSAVGKYPDEFILAGLDILKTKLSAGIGLTFIGLAVIAFEEEVY